MINLIKYFQKWINFKNLKIKVFDIYKLDSILKVKYKQIPFSR